jgi:ketosteroid isomerase-like protein
LVRSFGKKWKEAYENNDAAAVAALFTEDAVLVINTGPIYGREAIEKFYADLFQKWRVSNLISHWDQYCPHLIGTAGDELWSNGEAYLTFQGQRGEPVRLKNYWSSITVREGDVWKDRMLTTFLSPPPAAPAETK